MLTAEKFLPRLCSMSRKYSKTWRDSVIRNGHMNSYDGKEDVAADEINDFLLTVIDQFCKTYDGPTNNGHIIKGLENDIRRFMAQCPWNVSRNTRNAILVDFINFVAMGCGMDYAMYASDL